MLSDKTILEDSNEQIKTLLTDTISLILRSGIKFKQELNIEGLIGVHIDKEDAIFVHISHKFGSNGHEKSKNIQPDLVVNSLKETVTEKRGNGSASEEPVQNGLESNKSIQIEIISEEPIEKGSELARSTQNEPYIPKKSREDELTTVKESVNSMTPSKESIQNGHLAKEQVLAEYEDDILSTELFQNSPTLLKDVKQEPLDNQIDGKPTFFKSDNDDIFPSADLVDPIALITENKRRKHYRTPKSHVIRSLNNAWSDVDFTDSFDGDNHASQEDIVQILSEDEDEDHKPYVIQPGVIGWSNTILDHRDSAMSYQSNTHGSLFTNDDTTSNWSQGLDHSEEQAFDVLSLSGHTLSPSSQCLRKFPKRLAYVKDPMFARPYICKICGRPNRRPSDLVKHMRVHTGERPYECPVCNVAFKSTSPLYCHLRRRHGWKMGQKLIFEGTRVKSSAGAQIQDGEDYGYEDPDNEVYIVT